MTSAKKDTIHTITVFRNIASKNESKRIWGWCKTFFEAEKGLKECANGVFELGYYNFAVIEEVREGVFARVKNEYWYQATYNRKTETTTVKKIKKPKDYKNVVHFSLG